MSIITIECECCGHSCTHDEAKYMRTDIIKRIIQHLKEPRLPERLTKGEVCAELGIAEKTYYRISHLDYERQASIEKIKAIAKQLDFDIVAYAANARKRHNKPKK